MAQLPLYDWYHLWGQAIRTNKIPFIPSLASWPLVLTSLIIVAAGAWLTVSPLANTLGFVLLPPRYWLFLATMLLGYAILTQVVKTWFIRRVGEGWRWRVECVH